MLQVKAPICSLYLTAFVPVDFYFILFFKQSLFLGFHCSYEDGFFLGAGGGQNKKA